MIWCAEIGSAHNGSKAQAFEMIRQAKLAGATIAKFQFWNDEAQMKYAGNLNPVRNCASEWAQDLADWCKHFDIEFMASIWSYEALEIARQVGMERYKIAHQMRDYDLIEEMNKDQRETFFSDKDPKGGIGGGWTKLIYVTGGYPTYPPIEWPYYPFNTDIESHYGYSSHMHGYADALIAVARGAQFIEKHVTLNKADTSLRDNAFALSFAEFGEMVKIGEEICRLI